MARPVRIHLPGALYLVQVRVRPGVPLFTSDEERGLFLASVGEGCEAYGVKVYAYAMLEDSALLFLRAGDMAVSKFVHRAQAGYFNRLKALDFRDLPRIRDRHRAILVEEGQLFADVMRRVHLAPIIGGHWTNESEGRRIGEILKSRHTSLPIYGGQSDPPWWFARDETVRHLAHLQPGRPQEAPFWYIMQGAKRLGEEPDVLDRVKAMSLLGSDDFIAMHYDRARGRTGGSRATVGNASPTSNGRDPDPTGRFKRLTRLVARQFGVPTRELLRARARHPGRRVLVELAMRHGIGDGGVKEIGQRLNVSGSAVAHMRRQVRQQLVKDETFAGQLREIEQAFLEEESARLA